MKTFWILNFCIIFSLIFIYVAQFDRLTKESFLISEYGNQAKAAASENLKLESSFLSNESLDIAEELARNSNFEDVEGVKYIKVMGTAVAAK
jgi:hypothetical protein